MNLQRLLTRLARGGDTNTRRGDRRSNRPRGEGRGLIASLRALARRR